MGGIVNALDWQQSAWARQFRDRAGFAVQVFPIDTPRDPARYLLAAARLAEDLGLDAFFVGDHPAWALDPFVHLAAIAATTHRIRLGVNVCCALYRHPVMTARLAADVDNLSNGRMLLGLGNGWDGNEFANLGLPFPPRASDSRPSKRRSRSCVEPGERSRSPSRGQHFRCTGARVSPPPIQHPSLPIMIAGGGERVTLRQVARYADACNIFQVDPFGQGLITPEVVAGGRPFSRAASSRRSVLHRGDARRGRYRDHHAAGKRGRASGVTLCVAAQIEQVRPWAMRTPPLCAGRRRMLTV
jgi:alkanesulfonate monooxygenase SsuD/methylene tetrahydromethanopterin reductase-like flavin-dependent oxidoreductase (luciferase family)